MTCEAGVLGKIIEDRGKACIDFDVDTNARESEPDDHEQDVKKQKDAAHKFRTAGEVIRHGVLSTFEDRNVK